MRSYLILARMAWGCVKVMKSIAQNFLCAFLPAAVMVECCYAGLAAEPVRGEAHHGSHGLGRRP